jgi:F420-0:gamma-glutamyl ligase
MAVQGSKYKHTKAQLTEAIMKCNGTYVSLAKILGMGCSFTAQKRIAKDPELLKLMEEKQGEVLDIAEDVLMANLKSKNEMVKARTAEFILKTLPNSRYKEKPTEDIQAQLIKMLDRMMSNTDDKN